MDKPEEPAREDASDCQTEAMMEQVREGHMIGELDNVRLRKMWGLPVGLFRPPSL
jgi:hypothetical protein